MLCNYSFRFLNNRKWKGKSFFKASSPAICSCIRMRREELLNNIPSCPMKFNPIKTSFYGTTSCLSKILNYDFFILKLRGLINTVKTRSRRGATLLALTSRRELSAVQLIVPRDKSAIQLLLLFLL